MDRVPPHVRSRVMASVKSEGTRLERQLLEELGAAGLRPPILHARDLPGKPDFVYPEPQVAVFVDSCFWHGCRKHLRLPESNREYWAMKIARNRERDRSVSRELSAMGWKVLRVWEHSIRVPSTRRWWITRIRRHVSSGADS